MRERRGPLLLLTQGDPAGIGPELTLKAWMERLDVGVPPFAVLTDPAYLGAHCPRRSAGTSRSRSSRRPKRPPPSAQALPVIPLSRRVKAEPGKADPANAASVIESIETAVRLVTDGRGRRSRHQSDLEARSLRGRVSRIRATPNSWRPSPAPSPGSPLHPVMMLWSEDLAVVPVTVHIPLSQVPTSLTTDLIVRTGRIVARELTRAVRHCQIRASRSRA